MATLASQITEFKTNFFSQAPPQAVSTIGEWIGELSQSGIRERSLHVGQAAPDFALPDAHGRIVRLADLRAQGPVVVTFYRGAWCPFCNMAVRAYQQILPEIKSLGASFVAISPQTPDNSLSFAEAAGLGYDVLSDQGNTVARQFGVVYKLGDPIHQLQQSFGIDLPRANGDDSRELPLPGTFIVDQAGIVQFAQVFADHTQRTEPAAVLDALRGLAPAS